MEAGAAANAQAAALPGVCVANRSVVMHERQAPTFLAWPALTGITRVTLWWA